MELPNFDSEIPITAALDWQVVRRSYSILGKRLFMLMWIKWSPRALKTSHSLLSEVWLIWEEPGFKLISPESNSSNLEESLFLYLNFDRAKNTKTLWIWDVWNKLHASMDSQVKIALVDLSISFFVKRFGIVMVNKNHISKECFYPLMFVSKKHTCKHDGEFKKKTVIIAALPFGLGQSEVTVRALSL